MPHSRTSGLLLIVTGALTFLGTTNQLIPAVAFFPGLAVCVLGVVVFLKANHVALQESEKKTLARVNPVIKNTGGETLANRQAAIDGSPLDALGTRDGRVAAATAATEQVQDDELVLYEVDQAQGDDEPSVEPGGEDGPAEGPKTAEENPGFVVTTDVSFPLEIQHQSSLADQLAKLRRLADDGIISEDEFAVAKTKLLS